MADENACKACGSFLPGNTSSLTHGSRRQTLVDPEDSPLFQEWASDLGGGDGLSTAARVLLRRAAEADAICQTCMTYIMTTDKSPTSGNVKSALDTLARHSQTLIRIASLLGVSPGERIPTVYERRHR